MIIGACLALSSTAIVIEVLSDQRRLTTAAGRTSFAVLLAQDLAVVPMLLLVSILGSRTGGSVHRRPRAGARAMRRWPSAASSSSADCCCGRCSGWSLPPAPASCSWRRPCSSSSAPASPPALAGLSMALGAFVAGLLLAETEFRKAIETTIEPFKGLLLGVFFFTVGMGIDVRELARDPLWLLGVAWSA